MTRSAGSIDDLDVAIIEQLHGDGRKPFTEIARALGVSEATVRHRFQRLQRRGVIQVAVISDALALGLVFAEIGIRIRGPVAAAVRALERVPEVDYIAVCTGNYDLLIELVCRDNDHMLRVMEEGIRVAPGVEHVEAFTILKVEKHSYAWTKLLAAGGGLNPTN